MLPLQPKLEALILNVQMAGHLIAIFVTKLSWIPKISRIQKLIVKIKQLTTVSRKGFKTDTVNVVMKV